MKATGTRKSAYISVNQESTCVAKELRIAILALNLSSILLYGLKLTNIIDCVSVGSCTTFHIIHSCKMGTSDLPDMHTRSLRATGQRVYSYIR